VVFTQETWPASRKRIGSNSLGFSIDFDLSLEGLCALSFLFFGLPASQHEGFVVIIPPSAMGFVQMDFQSN